MSKEATATPLSLVVEPINLRVEQIVRAVYLGLEVQNPAANEVGILRSIDPESLVIVGRKRQDGVWDVTADTVTRLAMMGISSRALLHYLGTLSVDGSPVLAIDRNGFLIAPHGAVVQAAEEVNAYRNHVFGEYISALRAGNFGIK